MANVLGTGDSDALFGPNESNVILGFAGNDVLVGGSATDLVDGGFGNDRLFGGAGDDGLGGGDSAALTADGAAIYLLYQGLLGRAPDVAGFRFQLERFETGANTSFGVAGVILGSQEFAAQGPLTNEAFVSLLYQNALGRAPDADGLAFWTGALAGPAPASRAEVAMGIVLSPEAAALRLGPGGAVGRAFADSADSSGQLFRIYQAILGRGPDAAGFEHNLRLDLTSRSIADAFLGSAEFTTGGALSNEAFVEKIYQNALGRSAEPAALAFWTAPLNAGASRANIALDIANSEEAKLRTAAAFDTYIQANPVSWNDTLDGGPGDDVLTGGRGADSYVFRSAFAGTDTVYGLNPGDKALFLGFGYADAAAAIADMRQQGRDVIFEKNGMIVVFREAQLNQFSAANVEVGPLGAAPTVAQAIADATVAEDGTLAFTLPAGTFADADNPRLTLAATLVNGDPLPAWLTFDAATRAFNATPAANLSGAIDVRVTATDDTGLSVSDDFALTVTPVADAPTATAANASGRAGDVIALALSAALVDTDGSETLAVTIIGVPADVTFSSGTELEPGVWSIPIADLAALTITGPLASEADLALTLVVTTTETATGATASTTVPFTVTIENFQSGVAVDGYIAGATVFADANGNGQLDAGEVSTTTNAGGQFTLRGGSGPIVLVGGTDISTNLPFLGTLSAPVGSTVVTPLTTVMQALVAGGATVADAETQLRAALNLPSTGAPLTSFDPVPAAAGGNEDAEAVLAAAVKLQNTIALAASLVGGASGGAVGADAARSAVLASVVQTVAAGGSVDLANTAAVTALVNDAATATGANNANLQSSLAGAVQVITEVNQQIDTAVAAPGSGIASLTDIAQTAAIATTDAATALQTAGSTGDSSAATGSYTGSNLDTAVNNAEVGAVAGPVLGTAGNNNFTGGAGVDVYDGLAGNDSIVGLDGDDQLFGGDGLDTLSGGLGKDRLNGGAGDDTFLDLFEADTINGGETPGVIDDFDWVRYANPNITQVVVNLQAGAATVTAAPAFGGTVQQTLIDIEAVEGTAGNDTLLGGNATNNEFEGFYGRGGNDSIDGGSGFDEVRYDFATSAISIDFNAGTASDGEGGTDTFANIEAVRASNFNDTIFGSDALVFERFRGLAGNDTIDGRGGPDEVDYRPSPNGVRVNLSGNIQEGIAIRTAQDGYGTVDTLTNIENARGSEFNDTIFGNGSANLLRGRNGNDRLFGLDGNDTLNGEAGDDFITGGAGNDVINGGENPAGTGLLSGAFDDFDTANYLGGAATGVNVNLATGVAADGTGGTDTILNIEGVRGTEFADALTGGNLTNDAFEYFEGRGGNDTIDGGSGFDRANYQNAVGAVDVDLAAQTAANDGDGGVDTLISIEAVRGSAFADAMRGSDNPISIRESFEGLVGNDTIDGRGGYDRADYQQATGVVVVDLAAGTAQDGQGGTDTLISIEAVRGGNSNDTLTGSDRTDLFESFEGRGGNDSIVGAGGIDRLEYGNSVGGVNVNLLLGTATDGFGGTDTFSGIEMVRGSNYADILVGGLAANDAFEAFEGFAGADTINGDTGFDRVDYQNAPSGVTVNLAAGTATDGYGSTDALSGIEGARGSIHADTFIGDGAQNSFWGLAGNDTFTGGAGDDRFVFGANITDADPQFGADLVTDFQGGAGASDLLSFHSSVFATAEAAFAAAQQSGTDVVIASASASVRLQGVQLSSLALDDFAII